VPSMATSWNVVGLAYVVRSEARSVGAESYSSIKKERKTDRVPREGLDPTSTLFLQSEGDLLKPGQYTRNEPILAFVRECMASRRNAVDTTALQRAIADWRQVFGPRGCATES